MRKTVTKLKVQRRTRRRIHIRKKVAGSPEQPRMSVFRSLNHIYVQLIDDQAGHTLCSASSLDEDHQATTGNKTGAEVVGKRLAERAKALGISRVVFDRNGFRFHGRVKALADGARAAGLDF